MELLLTLADHRALLRIFCPTTILGEDARVDQTERAADAEELDAEWVGNAGLEGPMGARKLPEKGPAEPSFFFGEEAQGLPGRTEDTIPAGLFKSDEQVQHSCRPMTRADCESNGATGWAGRRSWWPLGWSGIWTRINDVGACTDRRGPAPPLGTFVALGGDVRDEPLSYSVHGKLVL